MPSYVTDIASIIKKVKDLKLSKKSILISLDVKSLYTKNQIQKVQQLPDVLMKNVSKNTSNESIKDKNFIFK